MDRPLCILQLTGYLWASSRLGPWQKLVARVRDEVDGEHPRAGVMDRLLRVPIRSATLEACQQPGAFVAVFFGLQNMLLFAGTRCNTSFSRNKSGTNRPIVSAIIKTPTAVIAARNRGPA
jgi:hypothetical protein